ncbi:MAG: effector-associated constant component EACC1 [Mycobacteriales bacterium]|jgi:hypothetical protein
MHGVTLTLDAAGTDPTAELLSFATWLDAIAALRGRYELVRAAPQPGTMDGGAFSHLLMQLADPQSITAVLIALWQWQRGRMPSVTMKVRNRNGTELEFTVKHLSRQKLDELLPEWTQQIRDLRDEEQTESGPDAPPEPPAEEDGEE